VATSAYQVEGATEGDGRGPSIWDTFCATPGKIRAGDTGTVACDHYHRYEDDIELMASMGVGAYRFSVSWPRIQPDGRGPANRRGLDHYRRVVDALRRHDIVPTLTLYHWDLPQALEDAGGWPVRDTAERFAEYAAIVARSLGDAVPMWITINEPMVAAWLGYEQGVHAPGRTDEGAALAAAHHLLLAHGLATEAIRAETTGEVGLALNLYPCRPARDDPEDERAADLADDQLNRLYLDPVFGHPYPSSVTERYAPAFDHGLVRDGDLATISAAIDFLGVNYYTVHTVTADTGATDRGSELPRSLGVRSITPPGVEVTSMGWPIQPDGLTEMLTRVDRDYGPPRLYVTENGAAFDDIVSPAGVRDDRRIDYLERHVAAAHDAIAAGVPLAGYFVWSLLDNFEWSEGYAKRFGLVQVDFATQERTPKDSALWYRGLIAGRS
jgi:beta-glucosidase